jgi:hypothetical protein
MPKSFEQRIAYLEKLITEFFTGTERKAKNTAGITKRKVKSAQKSVSRKVATRKSPKKARRA